jgi:ribosome biogenesis GTPase
VQTFDLTSLGWTPELSGAFASLAAQGLIPGRVGARHRGHIVLYTTSGEIAAAPSGRLRHAAEATALPVVGDWVAARPTGEQALIEAVLPRRTAFTRAASDLTRRAPTAEPDVLAANIDLALVVSAANGELNPRRLERYLATAWQSGAVPVVVLTKIDLARSPRAQIALVEEAAPGIAVHPVSNVTGAGVDDVGALLVPSRTAALIGPSGVGKSSLVNRLIGHDRQTIGDTDSTGRGRHTTTLRELLLVPGGGLVVDTPGLRALTPWDAAGLDAAFADVEGIAGQCRFRDCRHECEPGCAVCAAVAEGLIAVDRLAGYRKLRRELARLERKEDSRAATEHRRRRDNVRRAKQHRDEREGW